MANKTEALKAAAKAAAVKTEDKKAAPVSETLKAAKPQVVEQKAADEKETEVKEAQAKKAAVKKPVVTKAAEPKKEAEVKAAVFVEYGDKQVAAKQVLEEVEKAYLSEHEGAVIKTVEVYIKPEENAAYYVVNGEGSEAFKVAL